MVILRMLLAVYRDIHCLLLSENVNQPQQQRSTYAELEKTHKLQPVYHSTKQCIQQGIEKVVGDWLGFVLLFPFRTAVITPSKHEKSSFSALLNQKTARTCGLVVIVKQSALSLKFLLYTPFFSSHYKCHTNLCRNV